MSQLPTQIQALKKKSSNFIVSRGDIGRIKPVATYLYGRSNCGKTYLLKQAIMDIPKIISKWIDKQGDVKDSLWELHAKHPSVWKQQCSVTPPSFDQGYKYNMFILMDELYSSSLALDNAEWSRRFFTYIGEETVEVQRAFEDKGEVFIDSPFVMASGNSDGAYVYMNDMIALHRRLEFQMSLVGSYKSVAKISDRLMIFNQACAHVHNDDELRPCQTVYLYHQSLGLKVGERPITYKEYVCLNALTYIERCIAKKFGDSGIDPDNMPKAVSKSLKFASSLAKRFEKSDLQNVAPSRVKEESDVSEYLVKQMMSLTDIYNEFFDVVVQVNTEKSAEICQLVQESPGKFVCPEMSDSEIEDIKKGISKMSFKQTKKKYGVSSDSKSKESTKRFKHKRGKFPKKKREFNFPNKDLNKTQTIPKESEGKEREIEQNSGGWILPPLSKLTPIQEKAITLFPFNTVNGPRIYITPFYGDIREIIKQLSFETIVDFPGVEVPDVLPYRPSEGGVIRALCELDRYRSFVRRKYAAMDDPAYSRKAVNRTVWGDMRMVFRTVVNKLLLLQASFEVPENHVRHYPSLQAYCSAILPGAWKYMTAYQRNSMRIVCKKNDFTLSNAGRPVSTIDLADKVAYNARQAKNTYRQRNRLRQKIADNPLPQTQRAPRQAKVKVSTRTFNQRTRAADRKKTLAKRSTRTGVQQQGNSDDLSEIFEAINSVPRFGPSMKSKVNKIGLLKNWYGVITQSTFDDFVKANWTLSTASKASFYFLHLQCGFDEKAAMFLHGMLKQFKPAYMDCSVDLYTMLVDNFYGFKHCKKGYEGAFIAFMRYKTNATVTQLTALIAGRNTGLTDVLRKDILRSLTSYILPYKGYNYASNERKELIVVLNAVMLERPVVSTLAFVAKAASLLTLSGLGLIVFKSAIGVLMPSKSTNPNKVTTTEMDIVTQAKAILARKGLTASLQSFDQSMPKSDLAGNTSAKLDSIMAQQSGVINDPQINKVRNNLYGIIGEVFRSRIASVLFIKDDIAIMNLHVYEGWGKKKFLLPGCPIVKQKPIPIHRDQITLLGTIKGKDLVVVKIATLRPHANIIRYFYKDVVKIHKEVATMVTYDVDSCLANVDFGEIQNMYMKPFQHGTTDVCRMDQSVKYTWPGSRKGACGTVVMLRSTQNTYVIAGIHSLGEYANHTGICCLVSSTELEDIISSSGLAQQADFPVYPIPTEFQDEDTRFGLYKKQGDNFISPVSTTATCGTCLRPTDFKTYGFRGGAKKAPADLSYEAYQKALEKDRKYDHVLNHNPEALHWIRTMSEDIAGKFFGYTERFTANCRTLTIDEALGDFNKLKPFDPSTSRGMRCKLWGLDKATILGDPESEDRRIFKENVELIVQDMREGKFLYQLNADKLKDETRPLSRVQSKETRIFKVTDFVDNVLIKMALGDLVSRNKTDFQFRPNTCGINPGGSAWNTIYREFQKGKTFIGDVRGFESIVTDIVMIWLRPKLRKAYSEPFAFAFACWAVESCLHGLRFDKGVGFTTGRSNSSGNWITTWLNSAANTMFFIVVAAKLAHDNGEDPHEAVSQMALRVYSDDHLAQLLRRWWKAMDIARTMKELFHVDITDTDKNPPSEEKCMIHISKGDFLSRGFRASKGAVYCPLAIDSLLSQLYYIRAGKTASNNVVLSQLTINLANVVRELAEYEKSFSAELYQEISVFLKTHNIDAYLPPLLMHPHEVKLCNM